LHLDPLPEPGHRTPPPALTPPAAEPPGHAGDSDEITPNVRFRQAREQVIQRFERQYLDRLWTASAGNLSAAARNAGIDRKYLRELLKKHGLY
jgi:DNA-binding NtrC family response regulator